MLRPQLKRKYHVEYVNGEGIFLLAEREKFVLEGSSLFHIVPLLDGTRSVDAIVETVGPWVAPQEAYDALNVLLREGHLVDGDTAAPKTAAAFWSEFDVDTRFLPSFLSSCSVEVHAVGDVDPTSLRGTLANAGLRLDGAGVAGIAVVDDYLRPELAEINRHCLERRMPLLLVKPVGVLLWIGPLIVPGRTACWTCLEARLSANREVESYVEAKSGRPGPFPVSNARFGLGELQANTMAATQFLRWLVTGSNPAIESRFLVADQVSFSFSFHDVVRQPHCSACGSPGITSRAGSPIVLSESAAYRQSNAGLRSEAPEVTFERLKHHISPYSGVVSHVEPAMWHAAGPIRSYVAGHNFALKSDQIWFLKDGLRTRSSGKGWTDAQAKTSALCEALERYSGVFRDDNPRLVSTYTALGEDAVDPRTAMLFSDRQYQEREAWQARNSRFQVVPLPFQEDHPISWTPLWSLSRQCVRYLPTSYVYYNFPYKQEPFFCWADSNGAAAGRTLSEAILQGLFELIERDAVCLWWYNMVRRPGVDLNAIDDDHISQMKDFYAGVGREFWVLDLTADLGVPVFVAISRRISGPTEDIMMGFGAHLDARIALTRALTELNQFIPALLNVAPDGTTAYALGDNEAIHWWTSATIANQPYLEPARGKKTVAGDRSRPPVGQTDEILAEILARLDRAGHEVMVLDQTRPDIDLCVVKVVAPGLRHFWARFAPGRLYDVPVKLGWRDSATREGDLNPIPMFL
ncbi:TOMM precursor leader peptide-binding protein [Devosia nitrariae]|uniref:YcaO domain-containing protein n=1 Tax=Devosia nitrariae TaxID=2071872 RepID=A0ABQ5W229_9HYPH|nr:TOMM precursor leader peptide-binding protein [Devosia nitrariae]GLQ53947.1 hypothetical protein GCM10010862_12060 [Devosia nitrariae]